MRTRFLLASLLALGLAACSSGATLSPAAPSPEPSADPSVEPSAAPSATPVVLDVQVTFDGETCTYYGPTVILDGTVVRFEYVPGEGLESTSLLVYGVAPGTTWDAMEAAPHTDLENPPDWVYEPTAYWVDGAGTMLYTIDSEKQGISDHSTYAVGGYGVGCITPLWYTVDPGTIWNAALLSVAGP